MCFRREYIDLEKIVIWPPSHFEIRVADPVLGYSQIQFMKSITNRVFISIRPKPI